MRLIGLRQLTDFAVNSGWGLMKAMMGQMSGSVCIESTVAQGAFTTWRHAAGIPARVIGCLGCGAIGGILGKQQRLFDPGTCRLQPVRAELLHSGNNPANLCWPVRVPRSEGIARDRLSCRLFQLDWRGCQCVGFVPRGGGALGSRLQRWRCSLSFHSDTSISKNSQATPSSLARRRPRRPRRSKIRPSIPRTRQTTFARSARLSI